MKTHRLTLAFLLICSMSAIAEDQLAPRSYSNRLTLLKDPPPLLADYPEFVEQVRE